MVIGIDHKAYFIFEVSGEDLIKLPCWLSSCDAL